jgi:hypothetical protein
MSVAAKTLAEPVEISPKLLPLSLYRFSVEQYRRMVETGILTGEDRVELLEGWVTHKMPHNPPHNGAILALQPHLWTRLPAEWLVRVQSAITLSDSQPEPDLAVVRGPVEIYFKRHPLPKDIGLLIEVADATLAADRLVKGPLYARHRIPIYWIINLVEAHIEVYTQPKGGKTPAYRRRDDYGKGDTLPLVIAGQEIGQIPVRELLP